MSVVIPYTFVGGTGNKAKASEVNANFTAIASKFTEGAGGIADGDISSTAGIKGSKLSQVAGNRITALQLEDDAVDLRVLKDDATAGAPNAAVNTSAHIKDGVVTGAKLADATITKGKLKFASVLTTMPLLTVDGELNVDTTLLSTTAFPLCLVFEASGLFSGSYPEVELVLDTATNKYYVHGRNPSAAANTIAMTVRVHYLQLA
jgi:hypothetical protein